MFRAPPDLKGVAGLVVKSVHDRIVAIEKGPDAIAGYSRQKLVEGITVRRETLLPSRDVILLRDHLQHPIIIGAGWAEDIDEYGNAVLGELAGKFGVFKFLLFWHVSIQFQHRRIAQRP